MTEAVEPEEEEEEEEPWRWSQEWPKHVDANNKRQYT
jgi:hypothetical protein